MRTRTKTVLAILAIVGVTSISVAWMGSPHAREIGRTDPKRAALYRPPWFNFFETYRDGQALGVAVGSTKAQAIKAAESAGLMVEPSGWGDDRAGGADLYGRPELIATMLCQPYLNYHGSRSNFGATVEFQGDRVAAMRVNYINFEGP